MHPKDSQSPYLIDISRKLKAIRPEEVAFLCDFDGTISLKDVQVGILEAFARKDWRLAEKRILDEGKKSKDYLPAIYTDFRGSMDDVSGHIQAHAIMDPNFPDFVRFCKERLWGLEIVSDGLSIYIEYLLRLNSLDIPYYSNAIGFNSQGDPSLSFPNFNPSCGKCGSCKMSRVQEARARGIKFIGYVGDGISDECVSRHVDLLFAKDSLLQYCVKERIDHIGFHTFRDVQNLTEDLLVG